MEQQQNLVLIYLKVAQMFDNLPQKSKDVFDRMSTDFQNNLSESNPFLRGSFLNSLIKATSLSIFDWYQALKQQITNLFPGTAQGDGADVWGQIQGITRIVATSSDGGITIGGLSGSVIPQNALFNGTNGIAYKVQNSVSISNTTNPVTAISKVGVNITVDLQDIHNLSNNIQVSISGADVTEYNGNFDIIITANNSFTYVISSDQPLPNIASMVVIYTTSSIEVVSETFGKDTNLELGDTLNIQTPIAGVNSIAGVQFLGLTGGADDESDDSFRTRYLNAFKNPRTSLNIADIKARCFDVPGVTRVWVEEITPGIGQVTTYFVRDDDADILPSAGEIQNVKNSILLSKPAFISDDDIIVAAPTEVTVNFTFSSITIDTPSMRQAIENNLEIFFIEGVNVGVDVPEIGYQKAISNSIDLETGDILVDFTLTSPTGVITIADGELAILGDITFV